MTIDTTDGRIAAIPLGDLCACCVERPVEADDDDDRLCAHCRVDFEKFAAEQWREWGKEIEGWPNTMY